MQENKENKMGVQPVPSLLIKMSLPIMASMLIQALYNVVDSIFVAQIGEDALTAVSLAFPIQSLIIAVSVGTGVGIGSLLSRRLGEKRFAEADAAAANGVLVMLASSLVFAVFGLFFSRAFFAAFTSDANIVDLGAQYLSIVTIFSFGCFVSIATERLMQATGRTMYNMAIQGTGAILNIILDPLFIFGWLGLPRMGVAGAAVATVIGQIVSMILGLWLNVRKNPEIHLSLSRFKPHWATIGEIYRVGFPAIIMQAIGSVMTVGMNKILIPFSATAVSVFGVYFKLQSFVFMPVFGLTNGLVPIVAYNYGAKKPARIQQAVRCAALYAVLIMLAGTLLFELLPGPLLRLFNASNDMLSIGVPALRIISISFAVAGVSIVFSSTFQAIGEGFLSLALSVARQMVVILPVAFVLAKLWGMPALWLAFPLSEVVTTLLSLLMYRWVRRKYFLAA